MTETVKRIFDFMQLYNDNAHSLEINAGLSISSVSAWKKDKFQPSADAIVKIAKYFNVSTDYLLCLTDNPMPLKQTDIAERPITTLSIEFAKLSQDQRFVDTAKLYKEMSDEYRQQICTYVLGIAVGLGLNVQKILGR